MWCRHLWGPAVRMVQGMNAHVFHFVRQPGSSIDPSRFIAAVSGLATPLGPKDHADVIVLKTGGTMRSYLRIVCVCGADQVVLVVATPIKWGCPSVSWRHVFHCLILQLAACRPRACRAAAGPR
ncbi:hypothetical protein GCM10023081_45700 [Arthrobacter ginkgonis]|uniref:Uncharacterized protein n=1 Tax=Arthrobacter ginkgonis TaxID=1630594 RepID=A0ABP7DEC0_9MICC